MKKIQDMHVGQFFKLDGDLKQIVRFQCVNHAWFYHVWNHTKNTREEYGPQRKAYCKPVEVVIHEKKMIKCQFDGCENDADDLVHSKNKRQVMKVCDHHSDIIITEGKSEYQVRCPNCSCSFGVN